MSLDPRPGDEAETIITDRRGMTYEPVLTAHLYHLRLRELAPAFIRVRERSVQRLAAHLDGQGVDVLDATPAQLVAYLATVQRTTARSRYVVMSHLGNFYAWAYLHGHITANPMQRVPKPRLQKLLPRPISESDLSYAVASANRRVRAYLVLAAYQGLRACEIAVVDRADVLDTLATPALVVHGKGRKDRVVPLGDRALAELRAYGLPHRGPVFTRQDGAPGPTSAHRVSDVANTHLHSVGITDTLHTLRHRFATLAYQNSQDILVVGALLGHSDPATTSGYAAFSDARAVDTVRSLDGATPTRARRGDR